MTGPVLRLAFTALGALLLPPAAAQFDPAKVAPEPAAIAARYPDPPIRFATPGFREGRADFPSHAEMLAYLDELARRSPHLRVERLGTSQQGRAMPLVVLARDGFVDPARPTVLVIGQQHGNEPAGGETVLALAEALSGSRSALLGRVNVLLVPRGNPDGAQNFVRVTANGADVNRDHLLLATPEGRMIAEVTRRHAPQVALDLHEFTVGGRWIDKFGVVEKYDGLLQAASVGNLDPELAAAAEDVYLARIRSAFTAAGLTAFMYHTTNAGDSNDRTVSMGGVQPDTGRNVSGLRPAISLLLEVRGVGLGRAHFARRVYTQYLAALTVIETAAEQGDVLVSLVRGAGARATAQACSGELVIEAGQTPARQAMTFLDAKTGEDRVITVDWRAAAPLQVLRQRERPCGYALAASEAEAVARLRLLGASVQRLRVAVEWPVERYQVISVRDGRRQDARGAIDDADGIRVIAVTTAPRKMSVPAGSYYVTLAQPLSPLISAALEPDSQSSYAAARLVRFEQGELLRVMAPPPLDTLE